MLVYESGLTLLDMVMCPNLPTWIQEDVNIYNIDGIHLSENMLRYLESSKSSGIRKVKEDDLKKVRKLLKKYSLEGFGIPSITEPIELNPDDGGDGKHAKRTVNGWKKRKRIITREEAQEFINNSIVMFIQDNSRIRLYLSYDGNSVVRVSDQALITMYAKEDFDDDTRGFVEELKTWLEE